MGAYSKRYAGSRSKKTESYSGVRSGIVDLLESGLVWVMSLMPPSADLRVRLAHLMKAGSVSRRSRLL